MKSKCFLCCVLLPAEQLWIGEDLLQSGVVADAKDEDRLSRVAGKMPGDACREGEHQFSGDLHYTPERAGKKEAGSEIETVKHSLQVTDCRNHIYCVHCNII